MSFMDLWMLNKIFKGESKDVVALLALALGILLLIAMFYVYPPAGIIFGLTAIAAIIYHFVSKK